MNRLAAETSPYLLQHADNPVDWYPWGEEALARARDEDRPILLSVGYSACHWCHVMEHESFEDAGHGGVDERAFVSVKVDREERPDLDAVYMEAVVALSGQGGWPMTVFLTPAGEPFFGGTYYPPEPRHGMPASARCSTPSRRPGASGATRSHARRRSSSRPCSSSASLRPSASRSTEDVLAAAVASSRASFERTAAGAGRRSSRTRRRSSSCSAAATSERSAMVVKTLDGMAAGGMYDLLGGGFHRYSVDERWLVPHFEKMLYDNALLAPAYLHGWLVTGNERYREVAERRSSTCCASCCCRRAASPRRRTPTPRASRA